MKKHIFLLLLSLLILGCSTTDDSSNNNTSENPSVSLDQVTEITTNSAKVSGMVSNNGNLSITAKGVAWGTSSNPDITNDNFISVGGGEGSFEANVGNLSVGTTYFLRAFATKDDGTFYSENQSFTTLEGCSQLIFSGDVLLPTQVAVDNFASMGYTEITGSLGIGYSQTNDPVTDVTGLSCLVKVKSLGILGNPELTSLSGLENITSNEEGIYISDNWLLPNLDGLSGFTGVNGRIRVSANPNLIDIDGLSGITGTLGGPGNGELVISDNDSLLNIDGVSNIETVNGNLFITRNPLITNIDALSGISGTINGAMLIDTNENLTNLNGLMNISNVTARVEIAFNNLDNLEGISNLTSVGDGFSLYGPSVISNLDDLSALTTVGGDFEIKFHDMLSDFCGITNLVSNNGISGNFVTENNLYNPTEQDINDGNCSQ